jgi:hypothetical protein
MDNTNSNPQATPAQPLTPDVALQNLVVASRQARLSYQEHAIIDASINVLVKLIQGGDSGPVPLPPE